MPKAQIVNEKQEQLMSFIKHLNLAIRGKKDAVEWILDRKNYSFAIDCDIEGLRAVRHFCQYTIESYYSILLKPIVKYDDSNVEIKETEVAAEYSDNVLKCLEELIVKDIWIQDSLNSSDNYEQTPSKNDHKILLDLITVGLLVFNKKNNKFKEIKAILSDLQQLDVETEADLIQIYEKLATTYKTIEENLNFDENENHIDKIELQKILPLLDFKIREVDSSTEIDFILGQFNHSNHIRDALIVGQTIKIYEINAPKIEEAFNPTGLKTQLLAHGTKTKNLLSILNNGISSNPQKIASGSMLGRGAYFARLDQVGKSMQYADDYLIIAEVATGSEYKTQRFFDARNYILESNEYDSIHCLSGAYIGYDEFCIYKDNQIKPKYIIHVER